MRLGAFSISDICVATLLFCLIATASLYSSPLKPMPVNKNRKRQD